MKKYRLKIKYPNLFQKNEIGDIVYYNSLTKNYVKAEAPHYSVSVYDVENFPDCWELVEEKKPLFVTEDGVEVFSDIDNLFAINLTYFSKTQNTLRSSSWLIDNPSYKVFSLESNADQYIWKNKPVFSYEDFMRWGNVPYERVIKELAIERSKL